MLEKLLIANRGEIALRILARLSRVRDPHRGRALHGRPLIL